jgi:hypothetical protein
MVTGALTVPSPPTRTFQPAARLHTRCKVIDDPWQQSPSENQGAAGTSSEGTLVLPPKWQYVIPTELIDDPMLTSKTF